MSRLVLWARGLALTTSSSFGASALAAIGVRIKQRSPDALDARTHRKLLARTFALSVALGAVAFIIVWLVAVAWSRLHPFPNRDAFSPLLGGGPISLLTLLEHNLVLVAPAAFWLWPAASMGEGICPAWLARALSLCGVRVKECTTGGSRYSIYGLVLATAIGMLWCTWSSSDNHQQPQRALQGVAGDVPAPDGPRLV